MKKHVKLLSLLLSLCIMMTCFAACGNSSSQPTPVSTDKNTSAEQPVSAGKITLFQQKAEIAEQLQQMAKAYTAAQSGVRFFNDALVFILFVNVIIILLIIIFALSF